MKIRYVLLAAIGILLAQVSCAVTGAEEVETTASNVLLEPSILPFNYPQFDKIRARDFAPAYSIAMQKQRDEINAIANDPRPPTFDNVIVALERSGQMLTRVDTTFLNLSSASSSPAFEALERELAPQLAAHRSAMILNAKLFQRIEMLNTRLPKLALDAESTRVLANYTNKFVRAGARLSSADKEILNRQDTELASLQGSLLRNALEENERSALVVNTRAELAGMRDADVALASRLAATRGLPGKYVIALQGATDQRLLSVLSDRNTRTRLLEASMNRGGHGGQFDNRNLLIRLARVRAERAELLGYPSHAAYVLAGRDAQTPTAVNHLLLDLAKPAVEAAKKEAIALQEIADRDGEKFAIGPQDWSYYAAKLRAEKIKFDQNQLRPYFELNSVLHHGVFLQLTSYTV